MRSFLNQLRCASSTSTVVEQYPPQPSKKRFNKFWYYDRLHKVGFYTLISLFCLGGVAFFVKAYYWYNYSLPSLAEELQKNAEYLEEEGQPDPENKRSRNRF
uniref:Uncharacterized protein n=1 Tax=Romanomermis culicivorax TaxID=13658 RepID=A0A915JKU3_ROMCU